MSIRWSRTCENEVTRNPVYTQLMKLVSAGFTKTQIKKILSNVTKERINKDIRYLVNNCALELNNKEDYVVTPIGKLMAKLPLSIRASRFLAQLFLEEDNIMKQISLVVAAWMDLNTSIFYRIHKNISETPDQYKQRVEKLNSLHEPFLREDDLTTMLNIWYSSFNINISSSSSSSSSSFSGWCQENGFYERSLRELMISVRRVSEILKVKIIPVENWSSHVSRLAPILEEVFQDRIFTNVGGNEYANEATKSFSTSISSKIFRGFSSSRTKYNLNRCIKIDTINGYPSRVIALNLRKIEKSNRQFISKIVTIPDHSNSGDISDDDSDYNSPLSFCEDFFI